jgi:hypothetical protein
LAPRQQNGLFDIAQNLANPFWPVRPEPIPNINRSLLWNVIPIPCRTCHCMFMYSYLPGFKPGFGRIRGKGLFDLATARVKL